MGFTESANRAKVALDELFACRWPEVDATPVLLLRDLSIRISTTKDIHTAVSEVSDLLDIVTSLENQVQHVQRTLNARKTSLLQRLAPTSALPSELLSEIFSLANDAAIFRRPSKRAPETWLLSIRLSHVCRQWRAAAIATRKLWASIHVRKPGAGKLVPVFADRAGPSRLSVKFLPTEQTLWEDPRSMVPLSPNHYTLIQDLSFEAPESHYAFGDPRQYEDRVIGPLDSLSFKDHIPVIRDLQQFSSAHNMRINACSLHNDGYLDRLAMPQLEELVLCSVRIDKIADSMYYLDAPNLSHLQIIDGEPHPSDTAFEDEDIEPLPLNTFPTLQSLSMIGTNTRFWTQFREISEGKLSRITSLDLTTDGVLTMILDLDDIRGIVSFPFLLSFHQSS
ncbi:hypothetical protein DL93DRAFT_2233177 [Clavulina sp. PMI_390]|nr:hypothetical protein DL93DRAFT_2233177 [Clavulina sp. PMI_390]